MSTSRLPPSALLTPDWPAPSKVRAVSTTRVGGVSQAPFDTLNLANHVVDHAESVAENRRRLAHTLDLPSEPRWLNQVHGTRVIELGDATITEDADAAIAHRAAEICVVATADCLPVLLCNRAGSAVAAVHAGWRGLAAGIIAAVVTAMAQSPDDILVWLGPAIGPSAYEVGTNVRNAFLSIDTGADAAFTATANAWQCDLYILARRQLAALGITAVYGGNFCTYHDAARFYSYRRDGHCGRMASLIWLE